jgi:hypothetical protein
MSLTSREQELCELWTCQHWPEIAKSTLSSAVNFIEKCIKEGRNKGECWLHRLNNYVGIPEDEPFKDYGGCGLKIVNFVRKQLEEQFASCSITIDKFEEGEFWTLHFDASSFLRNPTEEN